jgi:hypothetical protein
VKNILHRGKQTGVRFINYVERVALHNPRALTLAVIMLLSTAAYTADVLLNEARYRLSTQAVRLVGEVNHSLSKKISLDQNMGDYRFNAENKSPDMTNEEDPAAVAAMHSSQKKQKGG